MTDDELIEFAAEFREGILDGSPSDMMCFAIVAPLAGLLSIYGIEADVIEGDLGVCNHYWLRLADGRVLDPTADQFNYCNSQQMPPVYLGPPTTIQPAGKP